jgi:hypothetical protein
LPYDIFCLLSTYCQLFFNFIVNLHKNWKNGAGGTHLGMVSEFRLDEQAAVEFFKSLRVENGVQLKRLIPVLAES